MNFFGFIGGYLRFLGIFLKFLVNLFWTYLKLFGFICDLFLDFLVILFLHFSLSNHRIVVWVTRPERPKCVKDEVEVFGKKFSEMFF